jgi:hypothetical protein
MPKEPVANDAMDSNRDCWLASPCARFHIVRGAIFPPNAAGKEP